MHLLTLFELRELRLAKDVNNWLGDRLETAVNGVYTGVRGQVVPSLQAGTVDCHDCVLMAGVDVDTQRWLFVQTLHNLSQRTG